MEVTENRALNDELKTEPRKSNSEKLSTLRAAGRSGEGRGGSQAGVIQADSDRADERWAAGPPTDGWAIRLMDQNLPVWVPLKESALRKKTHVKKM